MKASLSILLLLCLSARAQLAGFAISAISSPQRAGTAFTLSVAATNSSGVIWTPFTSTVTYGGTAGVTGTSGSFVNGSNNFSVTPLVAGSGLTVTVAATTNNSYTGSQTITLVQPGPLDTFTFSTIGTTISGQLFSIGTITALDAYNNTATQYVGTITMSVSSGHATVSPTGSGSFVLGVLANQSETLTATIAGIQNNIELTATGGGTSGASAAFSLYPTLLTITGAPSSPAATLTINATASGSTLTINGK